MTDLIVLAGGFGTRLRSAVGNIPKPLAPVAGRPFLDYLIESWVEQGVTRMTFMLHHQHEMVRTFLDAKQREPICAQCKIQTLFEEKPLGTGGAVCYAVRFGHLRNSFLVANADTWLGSGVVELAKAGSDSIGVVAIDDTGRYGRVETSGECVTAFCEKGPDLSAGWVNAGLYHLSAANFFEWNGQPMSLEKDVFPTLVEQGRLSVVRLDTEFIDIGVPTDYKRFCSWVEAGRIGKP